MDARTALQKVQLFSKLNDDQLHRLEQLSTTASHSPGEVIVAPKASDAKVFIVTSGEVELFERNNGDEEFIDRRDPGSVLGEMSLVDDSYRWVGVRAYEPTECRIVTREAFRIFLNEHPEAGPEIMSSLADRIRHTRDRVADLRRHVDETASDVDAGGYAKSRGFEPAGPRVLPVRQFLDTQREVVRASADLFFDYVTALGNVVDNVVGEGERATRRTAEDVPRRAASEVRSALREGLRGMQRVGRATTCPTGRCD